MLLWTHGWCRPAILPRSAHKFHYEIWELSLDNQCAEVFFLLWVNCKCKYESWCNSLCCWCFTILYLQARLEVMGKKAKNATYLSGNEAGKISREVAKVEKRRTVKSTLCNDRSSRSHCMVSRIQSPALWTHFYFHAKLFTSYTWFSRLSWMSHRWAEG